MAQKLVVRCTVSNCQYYKSGNYCDAEEILVVSDDLAAREPQSVCAPEASALESTPTRTCQDTCCKTFVPAGSPEARLDDVQRM
ncbi:MAG: DUF1540 domain-containing protein [Firmicutes bacterium]|nr:DUF1540 domain-containing protein [Bacillota bacterium]